MPGVFTSKSLFPNQTGKLLKRLYHPKPPPLWRRFCFKATRFKAIALFPLQGAFLISAEAFGVLMTLQQQPFLHFYS